MESTTLDINVVSARDLSEVNLVSKMDVYVVVSLTGDSRQRFQTNVHREGGRNPDWKFPMKFSINEVAARHNRETLVFIIRCSRALGDKDLGEVHVPVVELLQSAGDGNSMQHASYAVRKPSGTKQGVLNFQYKVGGKEGGSTVACKDEKPAAAYATRGIGYPPEGYPPPPPMAGYGGQPSSALPYGAFPQSYPPYHNTVYPPPPNPQAYGYPPHYNQPPPVLSAYGYPPSPVYQPRPPPGYNGYPPAPNVKKNKKKGMGKMFGLGAGLIGGMVGGLLLGDLASDIGSAPSFGSFPDPSAGMDQLYDSSLQSASDSLDILGSIG